MGLVGRDAGNEHEAEEGDDRSDGENRKQNLVVHVGKHRFDQTADQGAHAARELENGEEQTVVFARHVGETYDERDEKQATLGRVTRIPERATAKIHSLRVPENRGAHSHEKIGRDLNHGDWPKVGYYNESVRSTSNDHGRSTLKARIEMYFGPILPTTAGPTIENPANIPYKQPRLI